MLVIILAAGQSKRFQVEGYSIPKPFLKIEWRGMTLTMVDHVLQTIPWEYPYRIAVPPGYASNLNHLVIRDTHGPAETAKKVLDFVKPDRCLILDSDILNFTNDLYRLTRIEGCGVLVSESANPAFSYVDNLGSFNHIKEKQRISDYAVRGAYYVSSRAMKDFMAVLDIIVNGKEEPYISRVFDLMGCDKRSIATTYTPVEWGTPRDIKISGAKICV
jgi:hypothetical protein